MPAAVDPAVVAMNIGIVSAPRACSGAYCRGGGGLGCSSLPTGIRAGGGPCRAADTATTSPSLAGVANGAVACSAAAVVVVAVTGRSRSRPSIPQPRWAASVPSSRPHARRGTIATAASGSSSAMATRPPAAATSEAGAAHKPAMADAVVAGTESAAVPDYDLLVSERWNDMNASLGIEESAYTQEVVRAGEELCDTLYARYVARNGALPAGDPLYRRQLLRAFREGDVEWLEATLEQPEVGMWDFVYPPAVRRADGTRDPLTEGWARSPLALLVRPVGGYLGSGFLPAVSQRRKLLLLRKALTSGAASAGFATGYWACPAIQAALGNEVEALEALNEAGLDLRFVNVEWLLHGSRSFSLAHAAAFNGSPEVLRWLRSKYFARSATEAELAWYFAAPNGMGATPLDLALQISRCSRSAELLLTYGGDAFRLNPVTKASPLSLALERDVRLAKQMFERRTNTNRMWFGNNLVISNFSGMVLPADGPVGLHFKAEGSREPMSLEELLLASKDMSLVDAEVVGSLIQAKWGGFAKERYLSLLREYVILFCLVFACVVGQFTERAQMLQPWQVPLLLATILAWALYAKKQVAEISASGVEGYLRQASNRIDVALVLYVPVTVGVHMYSVLEGTGLPEAMAGLDAVLQIFMSWRFLVFISALESTSFGPFLVVVTGLLSSLLEPVGFIVTALVTFANAFTIIVNYGRKGPAQAYMDVLAKEARFVLKGSDSLDESSSLFVGLPLEALGDALLVVFGAVVILGTVGLFQNTVDRTVKKAAKDVGRQFRWVRVQLINSIEREMQSDEGGKAILEGFYQELTKRNGRPRIRGGQPPLLQKQEVEEASWWGDGSDGGAPGES
mmetsp:Transcript_22038/g.55655  ORF Transcript_22038/g.55655 Transcript_22038/m.55655 type:complete len:853 (+) Transcript_22038:71-2629(+)